MDFLRFQLFEPGTRQPDMTATRSIMILSFHSDVRTQANVSLYRRMNHPSYLTPKETMCAVQTRGY